MFYEKGVLSAFMLGFEFFFNLFTTLHFTHSFGAESTQKASLINKTKDTHIGSRGENG